MGDANPGAEAELSAFKKTRSTLSQTLQFAAARLEAFVGLGARTSRALAPSTAYLLAIVLVLCASGLSALWLEKVSAHRNLGMPFIIAVILAGVWCGARPAVLASLLSFALYRFFFTAPFWTFTLEGADALPLATFLATALIVGALAGRLSDRARSASERLRRLTSLFVISRDLSAAAGRVDVSSRLADRFETETGLAAAVFVEEGDDFILLARSPAWDKRASQTVEGDDEPETLLLRTARGPVGSLAFQKPKEPLSAADREWLGALAQLGAMALDRAGLASQISEAKLIAEKEGLRTALLSSLSHDLRTPIATILASASSLATDEGRFDPATRRDMLETIQSQADRLNRYVGNLLDMTRLETGALILKRSWIDPAESLESALETLAPSLQGHEVVKSFGEEAGMVLVDPLLFEQALVNIIDNAAKFAPKGSRIEVGVKRKGDEVLIYVEDEGPGIAATEMPRIFEKFFRSSPDGGPHAGVGLGLTVVRGVVQSFGGRIGVESPIRNGRGARFAISLPAQPLVESDE